MTDPLGNVTSYAYNSLALLTTLTRPDPDGGGGLAAPVTSFAYNLAGHVTSVTDPLGHVTTTAYDNLYRVTSITGADPDGGGGLSAPVTAFTYNARGQLLTTTDPLTRVTTNDYDGLGRLVKVTEPDPDGGGGGIAPYTTYVYDAVGNPTVVTDTLNHDYQYEYDNLYRRTRTIDPNGTSTWFTFDAVGNLLSLQDPEDNQTSWAYDGLDRVTSETNELGDARHFVYDAASNLTKKTDRNGRVTQYVYDNLNRLTSELWKSGGSTIRTLSFTYDAASQLTAASDPSAAYTFAYDNLGRATSVVADLANLTPNVTLAQAFDAASNRTSLSATIGSTADFLNSYTYDNLDRLTQVTQAGQGGGNAVAQKRVNFAYNALGQFSTITRYADTAGSTLVATSTYAYDNTNRLTDLDHARSGTALAGYDFAWDAANRITGITNTQHSGESATFTYDDFGQITGADRSGSSNDEAYDYDDNGNRETANGATYTVDANNRITSDGAYTYDYDDEGNRILKENISTGAYVTYTWDHRNRLTDVKFYNSSDVLQKHVQYEYDVFDRRVSKRVDTDGDSDFDWGQRFVYDGDHIALVFDDAGSLTNRYLHGPVIDQVLADEQIHWTGSAYVTDHLYWPLADHLGTLRDIAEFDPTANSGAGGTTVVNHITFDAFGNIKTESNSAVDHLFALTGREWDADAELYYYRRRWYDPRLGRFISHDPMGFGAGDANLARYVFNSPTDATDPDGLQATGARSAPSPPRSAPSSHRTNPGNWGQSPNINRARTNPGGNWGPSWNGGTRPSRNGGTSPKPSGNGTGGQPGSGQPPDALAPQLTFPPQAQPYYGNDGTLLPIRIPSDLPPGMRPGNIAPPPGSWEWEAYAESLWRDYYRQYRDWGDKLRREYELHPVWRGGRPLSYDQYCLQESLENFMEGFSASTGPNSTPGPSPNPLPNPTPAGPPAPTPQPSTSGAGAMSGSRGPVPPAYLGNNLVPAASGTRMVSDRPGGQAAAKALFDQLTGGKHVVDAKGHLVGPNGHRLRFDPKDGRWRLDIPPHDGLLHETIHFHN